MVGMAIRNRIMTKIMMKTRMITTSLPPAITNTREKKITMTMTRIMMRTKTITMNSLIPVTRKRKMRTKKNTVATTVAETTEITIGTTTADRDKVAAPAKAVATIAGNTTAAAERTIAAAAPPAAAEASPPWIATRSDAWPAKAVAHTTNNAAITDTTKEVAAADPPRVHPAEAALHKARLAEARKAPAEAALVPIAVQAAVAPPPGLAIQDNNATPAASSLAAADGPVMAAAVPAAAAPVAAVQAAAVPVAAAQPAAVPVAAAAAAPAAAAPVAARQSNDSFHHNKQIELATTLFV